MTNDSIAALIKAAREVQNSLISELDDRFPPDLREKYPVTYGSKWMQEVACVEELDRAIAAIEQQPTGGGE